MQEKPQGVVLGLPDSGANKGIVGRGLSLSNILNMYLHVVVGA